jgi:hypothetical protein
MAYYQRGTLTSSSKSIQTDGGLPCHVLATNYTALKLLVQAQMFGNQENGRPVCFPGALARPMPFAHPRTFQMLAATEYWKVLRM